MDLPTSVRQAVDGKLSVQRSDLLAAKLMVCTSSQGEEVEAGLEDPRVPIYYRARFFLHTNACVCVCVCLYVCVCVVNMATPAVRLSCQNRSGFGSDPVGSEN